MILDRLENAADYYPLDPRIEEALRYLKENDLRRKGIGRYEIDGENLFAIVDGYLTDDVENGYLEAHRKYIDVQFMMQGEEWVGYAPLGDREPTRPYSEEDDEAAYAGDCSLFKFEEGMFAIFYPQDLHMPGRGPRRAPVRKVVVKIRI